MAFAGALLQDMAVPLLLKVKAADYGAILNTLTKNPSKRLSTLEEEYFGWSHADASLILGQYWKLPDILVDLTSNHLKAQEASATFAQNPERAVVALSALLPSAAYAEWDDRSQFTSAFNTCFPGSTQMYATLFDRVDMEFDQYAALLQIASPKQSLFTYIDA